MRTQQIMMHSTVPLHCVSAVRVSPECLRNRVVAVWGYVASSVCIPPHFPERSPRQKHIRSYDFQQPTRPKGEEKTVPEPAAFGFFGVKTWRASLSPTTQAPQRDDSRTRTPKQTSVTLSSLHQVPRRDDGRTRTPEQTSVTLPSLHPANTGWELLFSVVRVHLGDGIARAKVGQRLEHTDMDPYRHWRNNSVDDNRPAHPPALAPGKGWLVVGLTGGDADLVEKRTFDRFPISEDDVLVFREGFALPTRELVFAVNKAHAVLVLRGTNDYFYLSDDFVLSADGEQALVQWGVGRPLYVNSLFAVGGTLLVALAERVWAPAVVGTLLVAAAGYRVQGVLTKVLRVRSPEWQTNHMLVPSGIHGTERVVQGVLVTLVALADLLDDRWLLLAALTVASVQVVVLEYVGQAYLTWGFAKYTGIFFGQLLFFALAILGCSFILWLCYVFAGLFGGIIGGFVLGVPLFWCVACYPCFTLEGKFDTALTNIVMFGSVAAGICAMVLGWDDADLKFSLQSLEPWRWPLLRAPDSFSTGVRIIGLWFGVFCACLMGVNVVAHLLCYKISSDGLAVDGLHARTRERKKEESPGFGHYDDKPIPSRHLLVPGKDALDVGQQTLDYFWAGARKRKGSCGPAPFSSAV